MKKSIFLIVVVSFLLLGCSKSNKAEHSEFVGTWENVDGEIKKTISIESNGNAKYTVYKKLAKGEATKYFTGYFNLKEDELSIGLKKFKLNNPPLENGTLIYITLEGDEFIKI